MSKFSLFMRDNKIAKKNVKFIPTQSLKDADGNGLEWELKPLSTRENDIIRDSCILENGFDHTGYVAKMITKSVIFPNLNDVELQNSYGVFSPEDLLKELVDNPAEYQDFTEFVTSFNGYETSQSNKVNEAKK